MEINKLELNNNIEIEKEQNKFFETTIGRAVNTAIDIGIRSILPDFLEDQIINVKDNLLNYGVKDGIAKTISDTVELGKSAIGIFTGKFENVSQMQSAVQAGGVIDSVSSLLDISLDSIKKANIMDSNTINALKQGKNIILNNFERNIEREFTKKSLVIENTNSYIESWKKCYENKDFEGMQKEYDKIKNLLKDIAPIEKIINEAKTIEILHNLIKNNGQDFNLTNEQLELAEKLR